MSQRTMRILIEVSAAVLAAAALVHAYFVAPLLFWPLVSLMASSAVLAAHSPMERGVVRREDLNYDPLADSTEVIP